MNREHDEQGATAVEYALIVVGIATVVVLVVMSVGLLAGGMFDSTCTSLTSEMGGSC